MSKAQTPSNQHQNKTMAKKAAKKAVKKSDIKQSSKDTKQVRAKALRTIFIDCKDPFVRKSIEQIVETSSHLAFKIVDTAKEAEAIIIDNVRKWVEIEKKGWNGSVVINTHDGEDKIGKHKQRDGVTYHSIFSGYVGIFVHISFNVFHFMGGGKKIKK
jgi:hypothetical protein